MSLINDVLRQAAEREQRTQGAGGDAGVHAAFAVARPPQRRRRWLAVALISPVLAAVVGGGAYWLLADRDAGSQEGAPTAVAEGDAVERPDDVTLPDDTPSEAVVGGMLEERQEAPENWLAAAGEEPDPAAGEEAVEEEPRAHPTRAEATAGAAAQAVATDAVQRARDETSPPAAEDPEPAPSGGTFVREPSRPDDSARADSLIDQAETHRRAGDTLSASQSYRRALEIDPERHEARIGYARMLARAQRTDRARGILAEGLEREPRHERMARLYAHLAEEQGDPQAGIDALEPVRQAVNGEPGAVEAHLAALYRQTGAHDQALLLYSELAEAEPDNGLWQAGIAVSAEALGNYDAARRAWEQAREREGLSAEVEAHAEARIEALQGR